MKKWIGIVSVSTLLLSGCTFGDSSEQQISEVLQQMHTAEEGYRSVQDDMNAAEQKEYTLFEEVLSLEQEQTEELTTKIDEMKASLNERKELVATEKESMDSALAASDFSELEVDQDVQALIDQIDAAYDARYATYENLYTNYESLLTLQETMYDEMLGEEVSIEAIRELVQQVNAQNDQVQQLVTEMNEQTEEFNRVTDEVFETLQQEE